MNFPIIKKGKQTVLVNFALITLVENALNMSIIDKMLFSALDVTSGLSKSVQVLMSY